VLPIQVTALGASVAEVSLGSNHTCARKTDGTLWCWGLNDSGQLGDGTIGSNPLPEQVASLGSSVVQVALGFRQTCARKSDGTLWCWGGNLEGMLGNGTTVSEPCPCKSQRSDFRRRGFARCQLQLCTQDRWYVVVLGPQ